jgi:hypothetical protein
MMAWLFLSWVLVAPASFGRHIAEIVDAYDRKRADLIAKRESAP